MNALAAHPSRSESGRGLRRSGVLVASLLLTSTALAQYHPTPPPEVSRGEAPPPQALQWLEQQKARVSPRDFELLRRGQATLYANILDGPWRPLRGICPSPYMYLGIWNWDAAFHAMAVARWDGQLAREQIQIFLDRQTPTGGFIDVAFQDGNQVDSFGKPPVMPWVCMIVHRRSRDVAFLKAAYPKFVAYERHWREQRGGQAEGLFHYGGPEPYFEAGWDNSVRWDPRREDCADLWPIDLNCYMGLVYRSLAEMAAAVGEKKDVRHWRRRANELTRQIHDRLWDEAQGAYVDRHRRTKEFSRVLSPASFMPLYVKIAPRSRAGRLAALARDPAKFFPGMPTVAYDHPAYRSSEYWRGPAWLNVSYLALKGLKRYGYRDTAEQMRQTLLGWCALNQDTLWEYYDSKNGKGLGTRQYGWTGAWVIEFVLN